MSAQRAYDRLIETYLLLDDGDHQVLGRHGLNPTRFAVLKLLDDPAGRRPVDLTQPLLMEKSSVTRLIDRLVQEGLVQRIADPDDRRSQRLIITPKGVALREQARQFHDRSLDERMGVLDSDEQDRLSDLLDKLRLHLHALMAGVALP